MTDVSNLDDLANKIASSSTHIKNYAKAQAAATQSQEQDIQLAKTLPPPSGGGGGASGYYAIIQPGQDVQAVINGAPDGAFIGIASGVHRVPSGRSVLCDTTQKRALRIEGLGGTGYNSRVGAVFQTSGSNQTLVRDRSDNVKHDACEYNHLTFVDDIGGGMAIDAFNLDFLRVLYCTFNGKFNRGCVVCTQWKDGRLSSDTAWGRVEDCRWRTEGKAIILDFGGINVVGGTITGFANSGIDVLSNSSITINGLSTAIEGQHLRLEGGGSIVSDCVFEQYNKDGNNVPIIEIKKSTDTQADGSPWPMAGNLNTVTNTKLTPHTWGTPGTLVKIGSNCFNNKLDLIIVAQNAAAKIDNQGGGSIITVRS